MQNGSRWKKWIRVNQLNNRLIEFPFFYYWFPFLFMVCLEFYLSSKSTLPQLPFFIPYLDKMEHGTLYGILGFFTRRAFKQSKISILSEIPGICAIIFCVFYGFSDEIHQSFVPNRVVDIFDVLADSIGGIIGSWLHYLGVGKKILKLFP